MDFIRCVLAADYFWSFLVAEVAEVLFSGSTN